MAEGRRKNDSERHFWQQVSQLTESQIEPPQDGWRKISAQIDTDRRAAAAGTPPPPAGVRGLRLPGGLVWFLGALVLVLTFLLAHQAQPLPLPPPTTGAAPPLTGPVDTTTRKMRIDWLKPPLQVSRRSPAIKFTFRITNVGSGRIVLPGPATSSRHYFLTVRHNERQWQYPLEATAADRVMAAGGSRAIGDLSQDQRLEPYEALTVEVMTNAGTLMPDGEVGQYQLTIRYAPPASSEKTSPPETDSPQVQVTVVK